MAKVASLGMYDGPALHQANNTLWDLIARRLLEGGVEDVPRKLDRNRPLDAIWGDPELLLAQCCGYPLATRYRGRLRYVTTPCYTAPGCSAASYRSRIVVQADNPADNLAAMRGQRAAVNDRQSNSGMNLFRAAIAPLAGGAPFFAEILETGSHAASLRAVAEGRADIAAIDAVSFAHLAHADASLTAGLRTIGWTKASAGLPYVTSLATPVPVVRLIRTVLGEVIDDAAALPARDALLITGFERLPLSDYDRLLRVERTATRLRYSELA